VTISTGRTNFISNKKLFYIYNSKNITFPSIGSTCRKVRRCPNINGARSGVDLVNGEEIEGGN